MDLRRLILVLTICSAVIPFANTFYAGYTVQRQQLIDATLQGNYAYANKLAKSTDDFLQSTLQQLEYTAQILSAHMDNESVLTEEATRLRLQTKSFNSVSIFDSSGMVLATSPEMLQIKGKTLRSEGVKESLITKKAVISQPYLSTAGNFIIYISQPIFNKTGEYLGAVGGSIYLKQESILDHLLGEHFYQDGSYLFVVDKSKRIIYHPDSDRVGEVISHNLAIDEVTTGQPGKASVTNSRGVNMLAGYASVPLTGWGIVAQRPQEATLAPLNTLMRSVLYKTLPIAALMLLVIWWGARFISQPLRLLANGARAMDKPETAANIRAVKSWYFESHELKKAMLKGIGLLQRNITKLREDVNTDPLTGLGNRRHLEAALANLQTQRIPFAVVAIDIDHFKRVNDNHGHAVGDAVLKQLAAQIQEISRADDIACRVGGEEFLLLLPKASLQVATQVAERLRRQVESTEIAPVGHITISSGVASWPDSSNNIMDVFEQADAMLYQAKRSGRNRVETEEMA